MAMQLVSTVTVGSGGAASIEFTSIPQTGKDLLLLLSTRGFFDTRVKFNGSATLANTRWLQGRGSTISGGFAQNGKIEIGTPTSYTANTFSNSAILISNYASNTQTKSYSSDSVNENNATGAYQDLLAGNWPVNDAITSILLEDPSAASFVQHSTASLYIIS